MPPPEFYGSMVAIFLGTALAVYMASKSGKKEQPELEADDVDHPADAFHQGTLPLFEESQAELVAKLRRVARDLGARNPNGITSDDIHEVCPLPSTVDPRIMGAVFERGLWEKAGTEPSRRKINHGREIRRWKLKRIAA